MKALPLLLFVAAQNCSPDPTSSDLQRERQETLVREGVQQVGMPGIKNYRELKLAKELYELRDQANFSTFTYIWRENAPPVFLCASIGYPLPYAAQYSAPESMQHWTTRYSGDTSGMRYGVDKLPQAEPNGLFTPASADATWIMCKDPSGNVAPQYIEPKVVVLTFKMPEPGK